LFSHLALAQKSFGQGQQIFRLRISQSFQRAFVRKPLRISIFDSLDIRYLSDIELLLTPTGSFSGKAFEVEWLSQQSEANQADRHRLFANLELVRQQSDVVVEEGCGFRQLGNALAEQTDGHQE
jgi:hypothetical protein